jgi:photosystem II stability/assembly factor-like uncharacterized protein
MGPRMGASAQKTIVVAAVALIGAATLAACGSSTAASSDANSAASTAAASGAVAAPGGWGHVHNIALDGSRLLLGTHDGLWEQAPGQVPVQVSTDAFDVMGLAASGGTLLASGHPPEGSSGPADLGLISSTDGGKTWTEVSLGGKVDFHRLVASGNVVTGISASDDTLISSPDAGKTWTDLGKTTLFDIAINPKNQTQLLGTSNGGPMISTDGGATFTSLMSAPLIALLAWTDDRVYGAGIDGRIYVSTDSGQTWKPSGTVGAQPDALAADGSSVVAIVGPNALQSTDGGATFTDRITGIA